MKSAAAIAFDYRPSRWLQAAMAAILLLAAVAIFASGIVVGLKVAAVASAAALFAFELRRLRRPAIARCVWYGDGQWRVRDTRGNDHAATLQHASVRGSLVVLRLRVPTHGVAALVLLPDNCDAPTRRLLRVRLAHAAGDVAA
jgi:hypothetical protein